MNEGLREVEHVFAAQSKLGEGPVWHPTEQALYWVDIPNGLFHRWNPRTGEHRANDVGCVISAMGVREQGGFVLATGNGLALYDAGTNRLEVLVDPDPDASGATRFNDGKTDRYGRFWAGKMGGGPNNSLWRLNPDGMVRRMESGIDTSNGLGWSPDDRTFYYTDSPARVIYAYDFNAPYGMISKRRVFASIPDQPGEGLPDGLAVDEEGCIWSARWQGWKIVRYRPDGTIDREIALPVERVTSCCFGGPNLDELYITSAWIDATPEERAKQPLAGDIFRLKTGVRGFPEPFFKG